MYQINKSKLRQKDRMKLMQALKLLSDICFTWSIGKVKISNKGFLIYSEPNPIVYNKYGKIGHETEEKFRAEGFS